MKNEPDFREQIENHLVEKANIHHEIHDNTLRVFGELKDILRDIATELNDQLRDRLDARIRVEYNDRGKLVAEFQIAGDVLIFTMHTNTFQFDREHPVWNNPYVKQDKRNSYCGMINIYNFLSDSLKYNRTSDEGYLIARLFINREMHFFAEGKRQLAMRYGDFGSQTINREAITRIVECSINYALDFDLLVPPYDVVKMVTVEQLNNKVRNSNIHTGKRLGYKFNSDDV